MASTTHITLEVVHLSSLNYITRVRQAGPVVQTGPVEDVIHLVLAFLGQLKGHHVHRQFVLGLGFVEVLLIHVVTGDPGCVGSQHKQRIVLNTECPDVVSTLLAEASLVLILHNQNKTQVCDMQLFAANKIQL